MYGQKRFFANKLCDYLDTAVEVPKDFLKNKIHSYVDHIFFHQNTTVEECDGGLYVGLAGVSYMCYYVSQHPEFGERRKELLFQSQKYMDPALSYFLLPQSRADKSNLTAFLLGAPGTYVVAASIMNSVGKGDECRELIEKYASVADNLVDVNFLKCGSDELFVGRAGYLSGILYLQKTFNRQVVPEEKIMSLCGSIIKSGTAYAKKNKSPCPLMYAYYGTEYLGAAHGLCSILQMLLSFPKYFEKDHSAEAKVKNSVDFLLSLQTPSGNFPCAMDEVQIPRSEAHELVHWCHGAPGVVYLMAKAYLQWKEQKYLDSCLLCGEIVWKKGLLKKGPGICHGLAGSGYVFLLLYRLTNDPKHLHRAIQFAHFLFDEEFNTARIPDQPLSLYEGLAGTVCFLADILQPEKAHFPFFDVF